MIIQNFFVTAPSGAVAPSRSRFVKLTVTALLSLCSAISGYAETQPKDGKKPNEISHAYLGTWVTADGRVRHHLLPNGRYDEARGSRESAYRGRYFVEGNHIEYIDDTGSTADGDFVDGVLYHGGMVLKRAAKSKTD